MTYGVTIMDEHVHVYEKCKHCHLFIEKNDTTDLPELPDTTWAEWVHVHRGDDADEAVEGTHNAEPSGLIATIDVWQQFGPIAMRVRFVPVPSGFDSVRHDPVPDIVGTHLLGGVPWDQIDKSLMGV